MKEFYVYQRVIQNVFFLALLCFFSNNVIAGDPVKPQKKQREDLSITVGWTNISCYGELDGKAWVTATGGTEPYIYTWSNGGTTDTISDLGEGTYTIQVEDSEGNSLSAEVYIAQPGLLFATVLLSDSILNCEITELTATIEPVGGTEPFTYEWSFPQGVTETGQTVNIFQPANYSYTVTDSRGCTFSSDTSVGSENIPVITLALIDTVSCNGLSDGSASSFVTGGVEPYFYQWSNGSSNDSLLNVSAGSYSLTVTDAAGCSGQAFVFIPQPNTLTLTVTGNDVTCYGQNTGAIFTSVIGGTPNYQYEWSNGSTTPQLTNLEAGIYNVTVTDDHGCTVEGGVTITQGNQINVYTNSFPVNCYGGNNGYATVFATGGAGVFQYTWSNGATGAQASNLVAGTYIVYATDIQNCVESTTVVITEPDELIVAMNSTPEVLGGSDGTASATVSGGTPPYQYLWENGVTLPYLDNLEAGVYTLTVTDNKGCSKVDSVEVWESNCAFSASLLTINPSCAGGNDGAIFPQIDVPGLEPYFYQWSNNTNDVILQNLQSGTYSVTIYDNANCIVVLTGTLVDPSALDVQYTIQQPTGPDNPTGSVTLYINGGTPPYKANYNGTDYPGGSEITITGIPSGPQSIEVKDSKGCSFPINFLIDQFDCQLTASVVIISQPNCNGEKTGELCVMYDNNFGNVTIEWSNDATTGCISGLGAGSYEVAVKDTLGCVVVKEAIITEPNVITLDNVVIVPGSNNFDGSISLFVLGGTPPFEYTWTKNGEYFSNNRNINQLNAGVYQLKVVDSKGCEVIFEPFSLTPSASGSIGAGHIKAYPNPVSSIVNIQSPDNIKVEAITLIDASGQRMDLPFETLEKSIRLDLSRIANGPLILSVVTANGTTYLKLLKIE